MALLLAGLPKEVPGATVNRLCASGLEAVGQVARAIRTGEDRACDRGRRGEHVARAVRDAEAEAAFARTPAIYDTTIGWRFVNPKMKAKYGVDQMPETAENVAGGLQGIRADQDAFALRSQQRAVAGRKALAEEIVPVTIPSKKETQPSYRRRASPGDLARGAREAEARGEGRRHGHRGQRLGRERRQLRAADRERGGGEAPRAHAARAHRRHERGGRGAARDGHGSRARSTQAARRLGIPIARST
jgi:acetyl-CoA acetyltransferase